MESAEVQLLLRRALFPKLQLTSLQALRCTSTTLRASVDELKNEVWLTVARNSLSEDHPLCTTARSVPDQATSLAQSHRRLRAGTAAGTAFLLISYDRCTEHLEAAPNHQGTMFISEVGFQLYLHELVPTPQPELRQILQIPGPEPESDEKEEHYVAACWAPDGSAVLLHYSIKLFSEEVGYQVVYLLELQPALSGAQKEVTRIVKFDDDCLLKQFSFTLTSGLILVMVMNPWRLGDREGHDLSVYDRSGQLIARFEDDDLSVPAHFSDGCLAHAVGERVAAARATSFAVWDLRSGRKLGVRGPWPEQSPHEAGMAAGQVVANRTGSSLAFCGTGSLDVHLFDAVSLEAQGTVRLAGSELLAHLQSVGGQLASIVWAAGGFLLQTRDVTHTHDLVHMLGLHFLKSQPGSSSSPRERLRCSPKEWRGWSVQDGMQPALTSDGAFVAMYEHASRTVEVWDTCSGRKAHTQAIVVPEQVEAKYTHRGYAVLSWGSSGLALLLRVGSGGSGELADQITLMQF